jgi:hypothetical protein
MSSSSSPVHPLEQRAKKEALAGIQRPAAILSGALDQLDGCCTAVYSPFFIYSYLSYLSILFSFYYYKKIKEQQTLDIFHDFQLLLH